MIGTLDNFVRVDIIDELPSHLYFSFSCWCTTPTLWRTLRISATTSRLEPVQTKQLVHLIELTNQT